MIKIENGEFYVQGTRLEITSEFMCIANSLIKKNIISKDRMMEVIALICLSEDELKKALIDYIDSMDDIGTALHLLSNLE